MLRDITEPLLTNLETRYRSEVGREISARPAVPRRSFRQYGGSLLTDLYHFVIAARGQQPEQYRLIGGIGTKAEIGKRAEELNRKRLGLSPKGVDRITG